MGQEDTAHRHRSASPQHLPAAPQVSACLWMSHQKKPPPAGLLLSPGETAPRVVTRMPTASGNSGLHTYMARSAVGYSQPTTENEFYIHVEINIYIYKCVQFKRSSHKMDFQVFISILENLPPLPALPPQSQRHILTAPSPLSSLQVHFEQAKHRVIARCPTSPGLIIWQLF